MAQKVIQIGSSAGITISPETLEKLGLKVGDPVHVSGGTHELIVRPVTAKSAVDPEILAWTDKFITENRELLERLADK